MSIQLSPSDTTLSAAITRILNSGDDREHLAQYLAAALQQFGGVGGGAGAGGISALSDATTSIGYSWISNPAGILKRIVAGSGAMTIADSGSVLSVDAPGAVPGRGYWDPTNGLYFSDDFNFIATSNDNHYAFTLGTGATIVATSTYGQSSALKVLGCMEFATGTTGSNTGAALSWGGILSPDFGSVVYNLGVALTFKTRVFLESALPATGGGYAFRVGIGRGSGTLYYNPPIQGFYFEYSPDNNSGQWRVAVGGASPTYTNTSVAVAFDTAYDLEIDVNAAWTTITFVINGVTAATVSTGIPTTYGFPFWQYAKGSAGAVNQKAAVDSWMIYYPVSR